MMLMILMMLMMLILIELMLISSDNHIWKIYLVDWFFPVVIVTVTAREERGVQGSRRPALESYVNMMFRTKNNFYLWVSSLLLTKEYQFVVITMLWLYTKWIRLEALSWRIFANCRMSIWLNGLIFFRVSISCPSSNILRLRNSSTIFSLNLGGQILLW